MAKKKHARARPTAPTLEPPYPRQLTIGETPDAAPPTRRPAAKALSADRVAAMAQRAVARQTKPDPSGPDRVSLAFNVVLTRAQLEALTARAIREGKALRGLIDELLAAAADRETP